MHWWVAFGKTPRDSACLQCRGRFVFAIRAMVQIACCMLHLANSDVVWTPRAYHGGDAVRHRKRGPEAVATKARMVVCGQADNLKSRTFSSGA